MAQVKNNWELFGFDMRQLGLVWRTAWREFLWDKQSPLRVHLDEVVCVNSDQGKQYFHAGTATDCVDAQCQAQVLPSDLVLTRTITVPAAAESQLEAVVALEVSANSPFPATDTAYGWQMIHRSDTELTVSLAIASTIAAMAWMTKTHNIQRPDERELWAQLDDSYIVLQGFGETQRNALYRRRLIKVFASVAVAMVALVLILGFSVVNKRLELSQLSSMSSAISEQAAQASALQLELRSAQEIVEEYNNYAQTFPGVHLELAKVNEYLKDEDYLTRFTLTAREIKLVGRSTDAAAMMQRLIEQGAYESVTATQAISKRGSSNLEQYALTLKLPAEVSQ